MTGSSPASSAVATARRSTLVPPSWRNNLLRPIRLEVPAARTTAATRPERSSVMDASAFLAPVVDHRHREPRLDSEGSEGPRVVARSEEVERGRWAKNVDEHRLAGDSFQTALPVFQSRRDVVLARRVELRRSSRSRPRPRTEHQGAARVRPLDRRADRERKPLRHQIADARTGAREKISAGGSDEDVDGALAT